jgi:hypothetical protein
MLRNKTISIVALAVIGFTSSTVAFACGGGRGHGRGGFQGGGFGFRCGPMSRTRIRLPRVICLRRLSLPLWRLRRWSLCGHPANPKSLRLAQAAHRGLLLP